jgi:hypothetical protein
MTAKTTFAAALTALTIAATLALPSNAAQARGGLGVGIAAGLLGAAVVGAAVANANAQPVYVDGYRRCHFVRQYDAYGYYIGNARVCR